ncbi:hypothetical protein RIF29_27982 [Crotalaria pallida]|uniref:Protein kinase domain-containing protein n=1 Tax=Crotalaria pallida TaxID=3830 RepID=A0AAN9EQS7_CROPI
MHHLSMAFNLQESTVIAIDKDKNSQCAVKWAVDHFLKKNSHCTLIHVMIKALHPHHFELALTQGRPPTNEESQQFFLPFRGFCARKGILTEELVLEGIDVPSALTEYIINNSISDIVVGASRSNVFKRIFKEVDLTTSLVKSLPESCTIHVVSKRKVQNIQPVGPPPPPPPQNKIFKATKSMREVSSLKENSIQEDLNRKAFKSGVWRLSVNDRAPIGEKNVAQVAPFNFHEETHETISPRLSFESHSSQNGSCMSNTSTKSPKSLESEIKKLKLELKRTTQEYTTACREAVAAKEKAKELEKFRKEEERNIEKARLGEEAALALAEVERQKAKAAEESAEMLRCLAEIEIKKRKQTKTSAKQEEEEEEKQRASDTSPHDKNILCRRYNIKEIEVATHYFDNALKIGEGGYGPVYKGVLDHTDVAIKALRPDITQGERQFQQEVDVLSTVRHPNMVILLGACPEFGILVYEYMENGTLDDHLFQKFDTPPLPWKLRFKMASEIATGLLFLHQTKPEPIVHRDLKPANILLDKNYICKISDVGLARLVPPSVADKTTQYHLTAAAGTFFYIDPEYQQTGLLGVKSDIYSLGVILLQIITGKPPMGVAGFVEEAIRKDTFKEVLDPKVRDWPVEDTLRLAMMALKCCEMRKRDRPDLHSVILPELIRLRDLAGDIDTYDFVPAKQEEMSNSFSVEEMENSRSHKLTVVAQRLRRKATRAFSGRWQAGSTTSNALNPSLCESGK